ESPLPGAWLDRAQISSEERSIAGPQPDLAAVMRLGTFPVRAVSFHPRGRYLAAAGDDGNIHLCDWTNGERLTPWEAHPKGVRSILSGGRGMSGAGGEKKKGGRLGEAAARREKQSWATQVEQVTFLAFTPDSQWLAGRFAGKEVRMVDLGAGKDRHFLKAGTK